MRYLIIFLLVLSCYSDSEYECLISEMRCSNNTVEICREKGWEPVMWCNECTVNASDCNSSLFSGVACCKEEI